MADRLWLTITVFTAVACLAAIHRAIFAGLFASGLVGRERTGANDCGDNRKDNFSVVFHTDLNLAVELKLREQKNRRDPTRRGRCSGVFGFEQTEQSAETWRR
jgi:hypothetical protein